MLYILDIRILLKLQLVRTCRFGSTQSISDGNALFEFGLHIPDGSMRGRINHMFNVRWFQGFTTKLDYRFHYFLVRINIQYWNLNMILPFLQYPHISLIYKLMSINLRIILRSIKPDETTHAIRNFKWDSIQIRNASKE